MSLNAFHAEFIYLDPKVLRLAAKHSEWIRPFFNFLFNNHLCIALSEGLILDLSQDPANHPDFDTFFAVLPWSRVKSFETVIEDEVEAYSSKHVEALLDPIQGLESGEQAFNKLLTFEGNEEAQRKQELYVKRMKKQLDLVKSNVPPSTAGCYSRDQAGTFSWMITMQWLTTSHSAFMKKLNEKRIVLKAEAFPSIQLYAHYIYYLCFLGNRKPKELSEFGDLLHLFFFPYCKILVLERNMYEIFTKIKSQCKILSNVEVRNIDFFKDLDLTKK